MLYWRQNLFSDTSPSMSFHLDKSVTYYVPPEPYEDPEMDALRARFYESRINVLRFPMRISTGSTLEDAVTTTGLTWDEFQSLCEYDPKFKEFWDQVIEAKTNAWMNSPTFYEDYQSRVYKKETRKNLRKAQKLSFEYIIRVLSGQEKIVSTKTRRDSMGEVEFTEVTETTVVPSGSLATKILELAKEYDTELGDEGVHVTVNLGPSEVTKEN